MSKELISFNPKDAVAVTGLLSDEDVKVVESNFTTFDYGGSAPSAPCLHWKLDLMDGSDPIDQYWSVGKIADWMPSEDGKGFHRIGKPTQIPDNTNFMKLVLSLINSGWPANKITNDATVFVGLECHVTRVSGERKGLANTKDKTVLIVDKVHNEPWKGGDETKGAKPKKPRSTKNGAEAASTEDVEEYATNFLLGLLADNPDGIQKHKLLSLMLQTLPGTDPMRKKLVPVLNSDVFLKAGPWTYENGIVKL